MIGNGYCNDEANNDECNYDGGDCCGTCVNSELCSDCACLGGLNKNGFPRALLINCHMNEFDVHLIGDGYCNGFLNNKGINIFYKEIHWKRPQNFNDYFFIKKKGHRFFVNIQVKSSCWN